MIVVQVRDHHPRQIPPRVEAALGEAGSKPLDDLPALPGDDLLEIAPRGTLTADGANEVIMAARAHWFKEEELPAPPQVVPSS